MSQFSQLYQRHVREVYRFAYFLSGNHALAEDIASETFVRVWHARDTLNLTTVRAFLFAIARNLFLEHLRREGRRVDLEDEHAWTGADPERAAASRGELRSVLRELQRLPETDRAAVLMRSEGRVPYEEIGRLLGISPAAARVRVHRARRQLQRVRDGGDPAAPQREPRE